MRIFADIFCFGGLHCVEDAARGRDSVNVRLTRSSTCPEGTKGLSLGFQPGFNPRLSSRPLPALKGRQRNVRRRRRQPIDIPLQIAPRQGKDGLGVFQCAVSVVSEARLRRRGTSRKAQRGSIAEPYVTEEQRGHVGRRRRNLQGRALFS